jgi:murein DD-endopeptidase MepM/ murein hydrolase activator NlpD
LGDVRLRAQPRDLSDELKSASGGTLRPIIVAFLVCVLLPPGAWGQGRNRPPPRDFGQALPAPGLSVAFHGDAACTPISSPYGSPTRYDGSARATGGGQESTHGGIDLTLAEGRPLLAVAPGIVHSTGEGGLLEGIFLWIAHLPERTGLPYAFLSKYQHLQEKPRLEKGAAVALGQPVALAGKTGTVGGYYGPSGYAHLHLTLRWVAEDKVPLLAGAGGDFRINGDSSLIDPLTIYVPGLRAPPEAIGLPADRKQVTVGYVDKGGRALPAGAQAVWPVGCP